MDRSTRTNKLSYHIVHTVIHLGLMLIIGLFTAPFDLFFRTNIFFPPVGMAVVTVISALYMSGFFRNPHLPFGLFIPEIFTMIVAYAFWHVVFCRMFGQSNAQAFSGSVGIIAAGLAAKGLVYGYYAYTSRHASLHDLAD